MPSYCWFVVGLFCALAHTVFSFGPLNNAKARISHRTGLNMAAVAIESEEQLNAAERLSRAASFYSTAVPVFAAYRALAEKYDFQRNVLGEEVSEEEEEAEYQKLHDWGSEALMQKITELKGFYIKTGQIISTRVDIFPEQYTSKLSVCQDAMESVPGEVIKDIVRKELLGGAPLSELFSEFDDEPLGSASIAQVHKARLLDGRVVAVKVQRPGIGPKLLGDIANLINFAKVVTKYLPVDYVKVFVEVQKSLRYELDFLFEAQTTLKVASAVAHCPRNKPQKAAVRVPLPIPGLVSTKVLVMEFIDGVALSQVGEKMKERGIEEGSLESKIFGRKLLSSLTNAYGSMIFGSGIIHADPHPGNIFVMEGGDVSLLDCGQVKELNNEQRSALSTLVVSVNEWENINNRVQKLESKFGAMSAAARTPLDAKPSNSTSSDGMSTDLKRAKDELLTKTIQLGSQVLSAGVKLNPGVGIECAAAIAILLFGNSDTKLPGGYAGAEISEDSPIAQVLDFPSEFILLGRATVMIKGIAGRVGIPWSLSTIWASYAKDAIAASAVATEMLPIWSVVPPTITVNKNAFTAPKFSVLGKTEAGVGAERKDSQVSADTSVAGGNRVRFAEVLFSLAGTIELLKDYLIKKGMHLVTKYVPESIRKRALKVVLPIVERYQANGERDVASA